MIASRTSQKSLKVIIASQYFFYFGVMGIFLSYFNLYCRHLGFTGFQIGALYAIRTLATLVFPLFWGALADRFSIRKPIYIFCNIVSTIVWAFLLYTTDFMTMFVITFAYSVFYSPLIAFMEAFTIDVLGKDKKQYGEIRAWGSISFIIIVVLMGRLTDLFSIEMIIGFILLGSMIQAAASFKVPAIKVEKQKRDISIPEVFLNRRVMVFLFCSFLMLVSHGTYYAFFSIHLSELGHGNTFIGIAWALASICEIVVMIKSRALFRFFSIEKILVFSFAVAALRWFILYSCTNSAAIMFSQMLHAVTYGAFNMACILYMDKMTPGEAKTLGQAINNGVAFGLGMMVGFFLNGYLYDSVGGPLLFLMSAGIAVFGGAVLLVFQVFDRKKTASSKTV